MSGTANWGDLLPRILSGVVMAAVGIGAVWSGGIWFLALVVSVCGVMIWELTRMVATKAQADALQFALLGAASLLLANFVPQFFALPILLAPALVGAGRLKSHRIRFTLYALLILLAGYGFLMVRHDFGAVWMLWLVLVVISTDIMGYFAGRLLGGPKFWPRISPKKTWSGTIAGWLGAAVIGAVFTGFLWPSLGLVLVSVILAFASQMGDIAQSALKRKTGVKDSSNLIPGHGGLFDRFDGMLGASVAFVLLALIAGFPPAAL